MKILVTGAAGFIGYHLCEALLKGGHTVVGLELVEKYLEVVIVKTFYVRQQTETEQDHILHSLLVIQIQITQLDLFLLVF